MRARKDVMIREQNERAWLAWHVAALSRTKKLPDFKRLQVQKPRKPQTWQEQLEIAKMWAKMGAGKIYQDNN